ncbi:MAG TPA: hypothetical protein VNE67_16010 [Acetobacteraceae bacterium]|nr:hypothetical protein [Acetobacteraceae bacterium]
MSRSGIVASFPGVSRQIAIIAVVAGADIDADQARRWLIQIAG